VSVIVETVRGPRAPWLVICAVSAASMLLGILTLHAQGALPDAWRSFANSASGWTLLTALLVFGARASTRLAAALGGLSFLLLVLGYTLAAELEGLFYSPMFFGVVGMIVGPFVGVAAAWLRLRGVRAALATALLSGVFLGEAAYGLTVVADTTSPVYWLVIGAVGGMLLAGMVCLRVRGFLPIAVAVLGTAAVAVAFTASYTALGNA
jgi:hypothetical protein